MVLRYLILSIVACNLFTASARAQAAAVQPLQDSTYWSKVDDRTATAVDFYSAKLGLVSYTDQVHVLTKITGPFQEGVLATDDIVTDIVIQDSSVAWAVVKGVGLYRGDQAWTRWAKLLTGNNITLVGAAGNRLFLYIGDVLKYTTDGLTLTDAQPPGATGDPFQRLDWLTSSTIFAVNKGGIWRSTDLGAAWTEVISTPSVAYKGIYADRTHGLVYAAGDELRVSADAGDTWKVISAPAQFTYTSLSGQVIGTHDCTGVFYVTTGPTHGDILRSQDQGKTFFDVGPFFPSHSALAKGWVFDRGSTVYWWDQNKGLLVSRKGIDGEITDSIGKYVFATVDPLADTLCDTHSATSRVRMYSHICTPVRFDSISVVQSNGATKIKLTPITLRDDSTSATLTYDAKQNVPEVVQLRVWFHGEAGKKEFTDVSMPVSTTIQPAKLNASSSLSFGSVKVDSSKTLSLTLSNVGCDNLRIDSVVSSNPTVFAVNGSYAGRTLSTSSPLQIPVTFTPHERGETVESIEVGTSAGHLFIELNGTGTVTVNGVASSAAADIHLYPIPVADLLSIDGCTVGDPITVYDALGRQVSARVASTGTTSLSLRAVPNGEYFVRCGSHTHRVIVAH